MNATADARATALRGLSAEHSDERRAAVEHFRAALWERQLVKKDVMLAIANAIDDADPTVALTAARAVVTQRWRYGDMDRILTALEKDLPEQPELAAKVMEVARRIDEPKALEVLSPWLVGLLASPLPDERAVARTGLANLAHNGTDVGPCVPALVAALGSAQESELEPYIELLYIAAGAQADTRAAEPVVEEYFGSAAPATLRYRAARLVTIGRFACAMSTSARSRATSTTPCAKGRSTCSPCVAGTASLRSACRCSRSASRTQPAASPRARWPVC